MSQLVHTTDFRSNQNDQIVFAANKIGRSQHKKIVFEAVYFGKKRIKTADEIAQKTSLPRKRVLEEAKKLVNARLIHQTKYNNDIAYEKDDAYKDVWRKVLALAGNKDEIERMPTKIRPYTIRGKYVSVQFPKSQVKIKLITIDDISSFSKVKSVKKTTNDFTNISESEFQKGILKILGETKSPPKGWGGEKNDIYTTRLKIASQRYHAAFALKGPGQKVKKLTPKHLGKNGDQIIRLMSSSAQVFIVQYWKEIDQSVVDLLEMLAIAKSVLQERTIFFGIIDGQDSNRLIEAYKTNF